MKKNRIVVTVGCMCASMLIAGVSPINAANKVEIDSAVAGISVAMNNFYAGSANPEEEIKGYLENSETAPAAKTKAAAEEASPYENLAVSRVGDDEGYVNIRTDANRSPRLTGAGSRKIPSASHISSRFCAAIISITQCWGRS